MKISRKVQKAYLISVLLVSLILATAGTTAIYAKYVKGVDFTGNVTVSAELVDTFLLYEHKVDRNELGKYVIDPANDVSSNEYILMPGVDIPKDPTISITGKTDIPAYLYIEVVDGITDSAITYSLTTVWTEVADITGPNGGKVYVYTPAMTEDMEIQILQGNIIIVSQTLDHSNVSKSYSLDFYAYMAQVPNSTDTPAAVFTSNFPTP